MLEHILITIYAICTLNTATEVTESTNTNETETINSNNADGILEIMVVDSAG